MKKVLKMIGKILGIILLVILVIGIIVYAFVLDHRDHRRRGGGTE